jgi:hypothetical protein
MEPDKVVELHVEEEYLNLRTGRDNEILNIFSPLYSRTAG